MTNISIDKSRTGTALAAALVVALVALAWLVTIPRMNGMDRGPGTDLGSLPFFVATWVVMMAAMMLPSALPAIVAFGRAQAPTSATVAVASPLLFSAGYIAVWAALGLVVFVVYGEVGAVHLGFLAWNRGGPYLAGAAVVIAGLYELTPFKRYCLALCRSTSDRRLSWSLQAGLRYGVTCVGCSAGLMLVLVVFGVLSLTWMLVIAALLFLEKVPRLGPYLVLPIAGLLIALGVLIALAPSSVPGLTMPMPR